MGVAATLLFACLLALFTFSVIDPYLERVILGEGPGVNATEDALLNTFSAGSLLSALLLAFFLGAIPVGWLADAFAGLNGALSAALTAFGGFVLYVGPILPWIWEPISNRSEAWMRYENLYVLLGATAAFCLALPFVALAGYLGGKLGRRLAARVAAARP